MGPGRLDRSHYELVAIGSGPAGRGAAVQAAKLGKRVAVVEREAVLGGVSTNTGTLPSKTLRAAIVELTGQAKGIYGSTHRLKQEITIDDLFWRTRQVIENEREVIHDQLRRCGVDVVAGTASFVDPHTIEIRSTCETRRIGAEQFVIAVGTRPAHPPGIDFDGSTVFDSDEILQLDRVPRTLTVIGGGVIGLEYASMAAALGVRVTLVEKRHRILDFVDDEVVEAFQYHLCGLGLVFRLGAEVVGVETLDGDGAAVQLRDGGLFSSEIVIHADEREGATRDLGLAAARLQADGHGRIPVDGDYRTAQPHIFAAGDVVGFPSLAATSMEQGRLAALAALGRPAAGRQPGLLPYGIYTIPEISFVGQGEAELAQASVPYVVGRSNYRELARGEIAGDYAGLLKLLVHAKTRCILGVHIFGTSATELVHVGQTLIAGGLTVDYLVGAVFNVPTFALAYKVAALEARNRLDELHYARPAHVA
jgi:NAD(P) transhydrogenase